MGIIIPASVFEPEYASAVILSFHGVNIKSIPRIEKPHCVILTIVFIRRLSNQIWSDFYDRV